MCWGSRAVAQRVKRRWRKAQGPAEGSRFEPSAPHLQGSCFTGGEAGLQVSIFLSPSLSSPPLSISLCPIQQQQQQQ